jgi:hypothetical protein
MRDQTDWVPSAVRRAARGLTPLKPNIKDRLLTDPRMKSVWRYLRRVRVKQGALNSLEPWRRLPPEERGSPSDEALAAFFVAAVTELTHGSRLRTRANIEEETDPWISPKRWRDALEVIQAIRQRESRAKAELQKALSLLELYLEDGAQQRERHDPYVLERSSGRRNDDLLRSAVRRLAIETQKIFGVCAYGTIARVVRVALQLSEKDINERKVENWCKGLPPPNKQCS